MRYFLGEFDHTMDTKGRVSLPSRFRDIISDKFYISKGPDNTLYIYPEWSWEKIIEKIMEIPQHDKLATEAAEEYLKGVAEAELDPQGRLRIDAKLREYALLGKKIVFTGAGNRIKIYAKEVFDKRNAETGNQAVTAETYRMLGI